MPPKSIAVATKLKTNKTSAEILRFAGDWPKIQLLLEDTGLKSGEYSIMLYPMEGNCFAKNFPLKVKKNSSGDWELEKQPQVVITEKKLAIIHTQLFFELTESVDEPLDLFEFMKKHKYINGENEFSLNRIQLRRILDEYVKLFEKNVTDETVSSFVDKIREDFKEIAGDEEEKKEESEEEEEETPAQAAARKKKEAAAAKKKKEEEEAAKKKEEEEMKASAEEASKRKKEEIAARKKKEEEEAEAAAAAEAEEAAAAAAAKKKKEKKKVEVDEEEEALPPPPSKKRPAETSTEQPSTPAKKVRFADEEEKPIHISTESVELSLLANRLMEHQRAKKFNPTGLFKKIDNYILERNIDSSLLTLLKEVAQHKDEIDISSAIDVFSEDGFAVRRWICQNILKEPYL